MYLFISKFNLIFNVKKVLGFLLILLVLVFGVTILPTQSISLPQSQGEELFINNCAGCHIKGGNIIRRNKTLKLKDLHRNGIDSPNAIAQIAKEGIGSMSGYKDVLGEKGAHVVANWIWEQSQNAWIQG